MSERDRIAKGCETLREGIIHIWKTCFGDDEEYINFCLNQNIEKFFVYLCEETPAAMLCVIPCSYMGEKGGYVYAVATLPEFRKRGYSRQILSFAEDNMKKCGCSFSVLVPAEQNLFDFYRKQGYTEKFYCSKQEYKFDDKEEFVFLNILEADEYVKLKNIFTKRNHLRWTDEHLKFIWNENKFTGGEMLSFTSNSEIIGIASVSQYGEKMYVREILCKKNFDEIANAICKRYKKDCVIRSEDCGENKTAFGVIKLLCSEKYFEDGYISLVLD